MKAVGFGHHRLQRLAIGIAGDCTGNMPALAGKNLHVGFCSNRRRDSTINNPAATDRGGGFTKIILCQAECQIAVGAGYESTKAGKADRFTASLHHTGYGAYIHQIRNLIEVEPASVKPLDIRKGNIEINLPVNCLVILIKATDRQGDIVNIGQAFRR